MKINDLTTLVCFKTLFETRSFTKTSELMALSKPALSKRLEALETELGFKLFNRTTRSVVPTHEADRLIVQVQEILEKIQNLNSSLETRTGKRKIRVTCISAMSQRFMGELLYDYQQANPLVSIELIVTDSILDLVENNIDLAIRVNPSKNSHLVGRKLGEYRLVAVAHPKYPHKIKNLKELLDQELLIIDPHMGIDEKPLARKFVTNDSALLTKLLVDRVTVGVRSLWDVKNLVKEKKLKYVLPVDYFKTMGDIWLLSEAQKLKSEEVRALNDYLYEKISKLMS